MAFKNEDRIQELINELDELGSAPDPVFLDGDETTAEDLLDDPAYTSPYKKIVFYTRERIWQRGTLKQMVIDRGGTGKSKMTTADDEPGICPECGRGR